MDWLKFFQDAWSQVPGGLLTTVLGFLGGFLFRWIADRSLRTIPARVLLGLKNPARTHIVLGVPWGIVPNTSELNPLEGMPIFGYGPLLAYDHLTQLIAAAYPKLKNISFTTSKTFHMEDLGDDLILIGFPLGNEVTKVVMNDLDLPLHYEDHNLVETATGNVKYWATVQNKAVTEDYGCIIRAPNPYASGSTIFIFAGCETYGVKAAAEFLKPQNLHHLFQVRWPTGIFLALLSKLIPNLSEKEYYQIVVSTHVRGLFTSEPHLVEHHHLPGKENSKKKPLPSPVISTLSASTPQMQKTQQQNQN